MDLRRLRYFAVLAEELHFTRAARRLHVAQPALSQQVRALEEEVGAVLIDRGGRGCALTPIGRLVADEAAALIAQAAAAKQRIDAAVRGQGGRLRVAYTRSARGGRVDALLERFRVENPYVEVVAETGWTAPNVAGLLAGRLDLAFVRPPCPSLACAVAWSIPRSSCSPCPRTIRSRAAGESPASWSPTSRP